MLFNKAKEIELHKSTIAAITLSAQMLEVALGTRIRFDELKVTAGKIQKDSNHEYRIMELEGILIAQNSWYSRRVVKCSVPLCKDKTHKVWMPTDAGVCVEDSGSTLWTGYWPEYNSHDFSSLVAVFEAHKVKSDRESTWSVGYTSLDRMNFNPSELPTRKEVICAWNAVCKKQD